MGCFKSKKTSNKNDKSDNKSNKSNKSNLFNSNNKDTTDKQTTKVFSELSDEILQEETKLYKEIDQLFHEFDTNNNLCLENFEFFKCLDILIERKKNEPIVRDRLVEFKNQVIVSKNKKIYKDEFRIILSSVLLEQFTVNELIEMFKTFDKKRDAKICASELVHIFKNLGVNITLEIAKNLIAEASYNGNNYIDFEEFVRVMLAK